jgi:HK97 family phage portal protein
MWPFNKETTPEKPQYTAIEDAVDELGLVKMNQLNQAIENAFKKHLDPSNLDDLSDEQGGFFQPEFDLVTTAARMKSVYRREPWVNVTANIIAKTLATIPYDVIDRQTGEVDTTHPMNEIMQVSNDLQDSYTMEWSGDLDLVLSGNFFRVMIDNQIYQIPIEYVTLRTSNSESDFKKFGPIMGIEIRSLKAGTHLENQFIPWNQVIHHKLPNPFNPYIGLSMVAAASRPILLDRHKNEFEMAFYLRGATHSGVIETSEDVTKERMRRLMSTFESAFTGRRNWFRQLWLPKNAKWVNSGLTMAEMQHLEGLRENRLTLLAVIGVPPQKVGIVQDVNRSTAEQQDKTFYENTIIPLANLIAAGWNNSYLVKRKFNDSITIKPNFDGIEAIEGGILTRAERARALDNIATLNEQREVAGLSPLKSTDRRGNMLQVELTSLGFAGGLNVPDEDIGPEDQITGRVVELGDGDGDNNHRHMAEIDEAGNGRTTTTDGEGPAHEHEIIAGDVQVAGDDSHSHPAPDFESEEEKTFRRIKSAAITNQESIESSQSKKYMAEYQKHLFLKLEKAKFALQDNLDVRKELEKSLTGRIAQYRAQAIPVLIQTQDRGFNFAQRQTRSVQTQKKAFDFSPQDELAIEVIKDSTTTEKNRLLEMRGIENFLGIENTENNNVMRIIEDGLEAGETTEQIAKEIASRYGERYRDQAFTIARTETLFAISEGVNWQKETLQTVFTDVKKQWFHVGDVGSNPDAREQHASFENEGVKGVVDGDHVWINPQTGANLRYPRDPNAGPQDVINCFVEGTRVSSHTVKNAFKRLYKGTLITLRTANGNFFTGTPNHPVLTNKGWVALKDLSRDHFLINAQLTNTSNFKVDEKFQNLDIDRVYDKIFSQGDYMTVQGNTFDFHRDGMFKSDVKIAFHQNTQTNPELDFFVEYNERQNIAFMPQTDLKYYLRKMGFKKYRFVGIEEMEVYEDQQEYVYNLSTTNELYTVEGFVTHNCRCSLVNIIPKNADSNASEIINNNP